MGVLLAIAGCLMIGLAMFAPPPKASEAVTTSPEPTESSESPTATSSSTPRPTTEARPRNPTNTPVPTATRTPDPTSTPVVITQVVTATSTPVAQVLPIRAPSAGDGGLLGGSAAALAPLGVLLVLIGTVLIAGRGFARDESR
jgi:hypothetical protein